MRRFVAIIIILAGLVALSASAGDSPTASLINLVGRLRAMDFEGASQLLADPQQGVFLTEAMKDPLQAVVLEKLLETVEVGYGQEELAGETATVLITLHAVKGEAIFNLNAYLEAKKALLPEDADAGQVEAAIREAMAHWDWKGMSPHSYHFRYHLVLVDGVWKLDHAKAEAL